jgi:membrane glycosyltransferase
VIRATRRHWHRAPPPADLAAAVVDPVVNALVCAQAVARPVTGWPREAIVDAIVDRALRQGLEPLSAQDRARLLGDPAALSALHFAVWTSPSAHASWQAAIERAPARPRWQWLQPHEEGEAREPVHAMAETQVAPGSAPS